MSKGWPSLANLSFPVHHSRFVYRGGPAAPCDAAFSTAFDVTASIAIYCLLLRSTSSCSTTLGPSTAEWLIYSSQLQKRLNGNLFSTITTNLQMSTFTCPHRPHQVLASVISTSLGEAGRPSSLLLLLLSRLCTFNALASLSRWANRNREFLDEVGSLQSRHSCLAALDRSSL